MVVNAAGSGTWATNRIGPASVGAIGVGELDGVGLLLGFGLLGSIARSDPAGAIAMSASVCCWFCCCCWLVVQPSTRSVAASPRNLVMRAGCASNTPLVTV